MEIMAVDADAINILTPNPIRDILRIGGGFI